MEFCVEHRWVGVKTDGALPKKDETGETLPPFLYSVKFIVVDKTFFFKEQ
jgi:hypothetical protein